MWKDILLIVSSALAVLMFFGITGRRLSEYARSEIARRNRVQKAALFLMITLTLVYICIVIWRLQTLELSTILLSIAIFFIGWHTVLDDIWQLSERGKRILGAATYSVFLPSWIASIILSDMLLWQKLAYPLGGVSIGITVRVLRNYVRKKRENRLLHQEDNKDSLL